MTNCIHLFARNFQRLVELPSFFHILIAVFWNLCETKNNSSNTRTIDQLPINKKIQDDAKKREKNLSTAWIYYKKAIDSVPHDWIIDTLKIHKFDATITNFIEMIMKSWKTSLHLTHVKGEISTPEFDMKTVIFRGDSPFWLHLHLLSLTTVLVDLTNKGKTPKCHLGWTSAKKSQSFARKSCWQPTRHHTEFW